VNRIDRINVLSKENPMKHTAIILAGLLASSLAQAQSHSVTNYSNPPGQQADSKAATDATPGLSATADAQDAHHAGKGVRDAQANKGKHHKSKGSKAHGATAAADAPASKSKSQSATAPVNMDGASKGGAEAAMQAEPSERQVDDVSRHAFDTTPQKK
jgi:hypothetical protein